MLPPLFSKITSLVRRPRPNRRSAKRHTPNGLTPCVLRDGDEEYAAHIHNLSRSGVGLLTAGPLPPGLMLKLIITNATQTFALNGEVRIVRSTRVISGGYLIGAEFTNELQHDQLAPFIV